MNGKRIVALGSVLLPVLVAALSMLGFAFGVTIGRWHLPAALLAVCLIVGLGSERGRRWRNVACWLGFVLLSVAVAGLPVMYTNADAEVYHRPAAVLLSQGWNPLVATEVDDIRTLTNGGIGVWHVAFLPRMVWLCGAAFYRWFGFIEVMDALNFLLLMASALSVYDWLRFRMRSVGKGLGAVLTMALCLSPVVLGGAFGGSSDAGWYSALLIALTAADRRWYMTLLSAVVVMSGIKFTGVVVGALIFVVMGAFPTVRCLRGKASWRGLSHLVLWGVLTGALVLLVNASPYLTSWVHHGGPFYPSHSFDRDERFEDVKNPITFDFGLMNDDARMLGYAGRFAWAYLSQDAVKAYYRHKLGRSDFSPDFKVSGGVGGFGVVFRMLFILALVAWPLVRNRSIHFMLVLILVSVLVQPTFYSGYARYVPQFYLFPWLVGLGLYDQYFGCGTWRRIRWLVVGALVALSFSVLTYPASMLALQWIVTVQNLQIITAAQIDRATIVPFWSKSIYPRFAFEHDNGIQVDVLARQGAVDGRMPYSPYFGNYVLYLDRPIEGFYDLHHVKSGNDERIKASRNANMVRFFLRTFLPREVSRLPLRLWQVVCLRSGQLLRTLWTCPTPNLVH